MFGEVFVIEHESKVLKNNPLNDPHKRDILVYLPPTYDKSKKTFPVVYLIAGFTGFGAMNMNVSAFSETIEERLNRLIGEKKIKEMIVVMPDCFTKYGGSQYVNSSATGKYEDYIINEIVPFIDHNFKTISRPASRCIIGKSSGGYGAMWLAMRHPDVFGLMATHSGDSAFEYCYMNDFADFVVAIENYGSSHKAVGNFIKNEINKNQPKKKHYFPIMNVIGMSACYSPNPGKKEYNFDLPFNINTGEIDSAIWKKWQRYDPIHLVKKYRNNLKKLKLIYIDCGRRDEFNLQVGARIFADKLKEQGIKFIHEEFDDGHMNIQYRYDVSLKYISEAITG